MSGTTSNVWQKAKKIAHLPLPPVLRIDPWPEDGLDTLRQLVWVAGVDHSALVQTDGTETPKKDSG
jgi:hypothetical protein